MRIIKIENNGKNYTYKWPDDYEETFNYFVDYLARGEDGEHKVRIGFGIRPVYGKDRIRVVIWIDEYPHAEFFGVEDYEMSSEVLSEIKVPGDTGERMCRYPEDVVPERYNMFNIVGLPNRVKGKGIRNAWGVVANIGDHRTMVALAGLRRLERMR